MMDEQSIHFLDTRENVLSTQRDIEDALVEF